MKDGYRRWLRLRLGRGDVERELDEEIETHLQMRTEELIRRGESPERARAEAERRLGGLTQARRQLRSSVRVREGRLRRGDLFGDLRRDLVLGWRQAWRSPGYSAVAVLTFGLGIGLTTAMYTLVDRILLRSLPYPRAEQLVTLLSVDSTGNEFPLVSVGNWYDWAAENRSLSSSALHWSRDYTVVVGGEARRVSGQAVAGPFFEVMGVPMLLGRAMTAQEAQSWAPVAVVSERFWRTNMGADRSLEGTVLVDGRPLQVIGVVPEGGAYPAGTAVWLAWKTGPEPGAQRNNINWYAVARLRPGVTMAQARADLSAIADRIRATDPAGIYSYGVGLRPLQETVVGDVSRSLLLLMGGVLFVLLIACVNLAGLGLARGAARVREIAVRLALGSGRGRIVRQVGTETLVLAMAGGVLGLSLAWWITRVLAAAYAQQIPRAAEITIDVRVVAFAVATTLLAALIATVGPALKVSGVSLRALIGNDRGAVRGGRTLPGAGLVAAELALAVSLLTGGALLVRSFRAVLSQELGYDTRGVLTADLALSSGTYVNDIGARLAYWDRLLQRVRAIPGVEAAGAANWIPTGSGGSSFIELEGVRGGRPGAGYRVVTEDYFRALGVPLLAGRLFEMRDVAGAERVALVNRRFADTYWPGLNPVGRRVRALSMEDHLPGRAPWLTVIGVVDDMRHWGPEREHQPEMYVLHRQVPTMVWVMTAVVRVDPARIGALRESVRAEIAALDRTVAVETQLLADRVSALREERRLVMSLLTGFAALAVALACIGLYGLLSFAVAQRTREIGVRAALGARQTRIVRLMMANALRVVALGTVAGLLGAAWLTRLMSALLFGVTPGDWVSYAASATILVIVATFAALVPAWRAARLDPLTALRY